MLVSWLKAARFPSQLYLLFPLVLGQFFHYYETKKFDLGLFILILFFGIFLQLYIVFANDVADEKTDRLNQTASFFSGGSKVLVDENIGKKSLSYAAIIMAILVLLSSYYIGIMADRRVEIMTLSFCAISLLWVYSYPPIKLSYRGGGELLQMLGLGILLPYLAYMAQGGSRLPHELGFLLPSHLACAISTGLSDVDSDFH